MNNFLTSEFIRKFVGEIIFPRGLKETVEAKHIHIEQSLGCIGKRTRITGIGESTAPRALR